MLRFSASLPLIGDFSKNQEAYRKRNLPVVKVCGIAMTDTEHLRHGAARLSCLAIMLSGLCQGS